MRKNFLYKILALMLMSLLPECGVLAQGDVQKTNVLGAQSESVAEQCDTLVDVHIDSNGDTIYTYSISPIGLVPMTRTSSGESIYSDEGTDDEGMIAVLDTDVSNATMKNVGSVPFDESVSPSGARIYSVPIRTAPGLAFVPNISLAYNSQSGNGVAGYGWNVSGGSVITLVQKTIHYDGTCAPIDVSNPSECVFALDGVRLIPNCGVLTSKYQYETAQGKILVEKHLSGNTVAYFTVAYPNGNVATFGFKDNTAMRVVYPITELRDVRGNMMSFQYFEAGNNYYLSKVSYGSRPSSRYLAEIDFLYEDRDDFTEMYIGGLKVSASKILKGVVSKTMFNGSMQELCSYVLSHKNTGGACRLSQLDCTSGGQSLTPLTFSYIADRNSAPARMNRNGSLFLEKYFAKESGAKPVFVRGKFVKNRYDDGLITFPGKFSPYGVVGYKKTLSGNKYPAFGSCFPENQTVLIASAISSLSYVDSITVEKGFQTIQALDIDGDDTDEIVKVNFAGASKDNTNLRITVYRRNDGGFAGQSFDVTVKGAINSGSNTYSPMFRSYIWGDFVGNGKKQLLSVAHNVTNYGDKSASSFALIDLDGKKLVSDTTPFQFTDEDMKYTFALDINGDGRAELCHVGNSVLDIYTLADGSFTKTRTVSFMDRKKFSERAFFGDVNGDGYVDVVVSPEKSYEKFEDRCPGLGSRELQELWFRRPYNRLEQDYLQKLQFQFEGLFVEWAQQCCMPPVRSAIGYIKRPQRGVLSIRWNRSEL